MFLVFASISQSAVATSILTPTTLLDRIDKRDGISLERVTDIGAVSWSSAGDSEVLASARFAGYNDVPGVIPGTKSGLDRQSLVSSLKSNGLPGPLGLSSMPEPGTLALAVLGMVWLGYPLRRKVGFMAWQTCRRMPWGCLDRLMQSSASVRTLLKKILLHILVGRSSIRPDVVHEHMRVRLPDASFCTAWVSGSEYRNRDRLFSGAAS
jgi:hypothetical protein